MLFTRASTVKSLRRVQEHFLMPSKRKRDAAYYEARLRKEHPGIFGDLKTGKHTSVRAAAAAARLIHLPGRLGALKREWRKAAPAERKAFVDWLRKSSAPTTTASRSITLRNGKLQPDVIAFLGTWTATNRATPGRIMKQIGFSGYDYRLAQAIAGAPLKHEVAAKLEGWLLGTASGYDEAPRGRCNYSEAASNGRRRRKARAGL